MRSIARAMTDWRVSRAGQPGTSAIEGNIAHSAMSTPSTPAMPPSTLSTMRIGPNGSA
jgi:hypothetical protein